MTLFGDDNKEQEKYDFRKQETIGGHNLMEVVSALQKAIRRSDEDQAMYWGMQLLLSGFAKYGWKRLRVIASEDVGLADSQAVLMVHTLYSAWLDYDKNDKGISNNLFYVHAVMLLARAKKSRIIDENFCYFSSGIKNGSIYYEIPDYALDMHTRRGKEQGKGINHFCTEGRKLINIWDLEQEKYYTKRADKIDGINTHIPYLEGEDNEKNTEKEA